MHYHNEGIKLLKPSLSRIIPSHRRSQTEGSNPCEIKQLKSCLNRTELSKYSGSSSKYNKLFANTIDNRYFNFISKKEHHNENNMQKISMRLRKIEGLKQNNDSIKHNFNKLNTQKKDTGKLNSKKVSFAQGRQKSRQVMFASIQNYKQPLISPGGQKNQIIQNLPCNPWQFQIEKICKSIDQLRNVGISDKKINNWCSCYFQNKKKGLINIFMKKQQKKKSLRDQIMYSVHSIQNQLLQALQNASKNMSEKQKYFLGVEVNLYRSFLQQKIAGKHRLQLNQIEDRVKSNLEHSYMKQYAKQLYQNDAVSLQISNFYQDLQRIEQNYGKLQLVSVKNRRRFQNITASESNIKKFVYS